jgi:nicotinamide riboside kinase
LEKIVFTGPESSGKTWLATYFSKKYNLTLIPEYSRIYLNGHGPVYSFEDLKTIALGQIQMEKDYSSISTNPVLMDTDLITLKIWSEFKFGICDSLILDQVQSIKNRYYLLCKPDIPWKADVQRENQNDRDLLFKIYENELQSLNLSYTVIEGDFDYRLELANHHINQILHK